MQILARKQLLFGNKGTSISPCDHCLIVLHSSASIHGASERKFDILELVIFDACGPMKCGSLCGALHSIAFIDDSPRKVCLCYEIKRSS